MAGGQNPFGKLKAALRALPVSLANDVAQASAPGLTSRTRGAYDAGQTVYGEARPKGVHGQRLTLERTGAARETMRFVANGRIVRCVVDVRDKYGRKYGQYLIGKYKILPNGGLPVEWKRFLDELVRQADAAKYLREGP